MALLLRPRGESFDFEADRGPHREGRNMINLVTEPIHPTSTPNPAGADFLARFNEAMEILDPSTELTGWRGAHPGWTETTIYPPVRVQREAAI
jgi:hypothetical protein